MSAGQATNLTLADLQQFDPQPLRSGRYDRYLCPLVGCSDGKPHDKQHKSLCVERDTGKWRCHRCKNWGTLKDFWTERPKQTAKERQQKQAWRIIHGESKPVQQASQDSVKGFREQITSNKPLAGSPAETYLLNRRIPLDLASSHRIK